MTNRLTYVIAVSRCLRIFIGLLLILFLAGMPLSAAERASHTKPTHEIKIGIIGDQTFSRDIQASYRVLEQGVGILSAQSVNVVLHAGDLVESTLSPPEVTALFNQATGILDRLPVPWYLTAGDHDVNPPTFQQDSADRSREQLFQQLYGKRVPTFAKHPWYSFDIGAYHFISLYSFGALDSDSRFGNIFLSQVYDEQFAFLQADLNAHARARAIIVWIHQPLWYHVSGWMRVHELLRKFPVAAVISGHFHYNQDGGIIDGIHYFTVGATGGSKKNGSREAGSVDQVSVMTISDHRHVSMKLIALDNLPLNLTPRVDMDRVQALDVQLGNFFDFGQINPIFNKGGQLVNDCKSTSPATVRINEIGDPIDLPLNVKISFNSSPAGVSLNAPNFATGQCQQVVSPTECVLKRTARTFLSNYSSVNTDNSNPLWMSGLSGSATPGTSLNFEIKTTFTGASGELFLQTMASTVIGTCP